MMIAPSPWRWIVGCALCLILGLITIGCSGASPGDGQTAAATSTAGTPTAETSALELNRDALAAGLDTLGAQDSNVHSIVVSHHGRSELEVDLWPSTGRDLHDLASLTKSVVVLTAGAAVQRGDIESLDIELGGVLRRAAGTGVASVTLRELLSMRAGLDCRLEGGEPRLREMLEAADYVGYATSIAPAGVRGETFAYCSPGYHLVSAALAEATGMSLADYATKVLFDPLGIDRVRWPHDREGVTHGWGDLELRPGDVARIGQLVVQDGRWDGSRLLPAGFVAEIAEGRPTDDAETAYGMGWWLAADTPADVLEGIGRGGQELLVWPRERLVVVVTGAGVDGRLIARAVVDALGSPEARVRTTEAQIAAKAAALASAPEPTPPTVPEAGLPIDRSFLLEENPLGLSRVTLRQREVDAAIVILTQGPERFELSVGLDGVSRTTDHTPTGRAAGATGRWTGETLAVDYEEVAGPEHLAIELDMNDPVTMTVTDIGDPAAPIEVRGRRVR